MASLCHPWFTTTKLSYRFRIFETSVTALCGTTGIGEPIFRQSPLTKYKCKLDPSKTSTIWCSFFSMTRDHRVKSYVRQRGLLGQCSPLQSHPSWTSLGGRCLKSLAQSFRFSWLSATEVSKHLPICPKHHIHLGLAANSDNLNDLNDLARLSSGTVRVDQWSFLSRSGMKECYSWVSVWKPRRTRAVGHEI